MSDLNQKPTDVERHAEVHKTIYNVEIKRELPDECTLAEECGALVKQENLDGDCAESCHNVYDTLFDVIKHETPGMEHQGDCHVDAPATGSGFRNVSPGQMETYRKPEPSQAAEGLLTAVTFTLDFTTCATSPRLLSETQSADTNRRIMPRKKSNLDNACSRNTRLQRALRARQSEEETAARNAAQRIRTAEIRRQESQEQREKRLRQNVLRTRTARQQNIARFRELERTRQQTRRALTRTSFFRLAFEYK